MYIYIYECIYICTYMVHVIYWYRYYRRGVAGIYI